MFVILKDKPYANMTMPGKVQLYMATIHCAFIKLFRNKV